jgi:hypothetical protein
MPNSAPTPSKVRGSAPRNPNPSRKSAAPRQTSPPVTDDSLDGAIEAESNGSSQLRRLPAEAEIAARAYCISEARRKTGQQGDELSDWLQAEAELLTEQF